jgi:uncharacterized protein
VILIDANILVYAYNSSAVQHARAAEWLADALAGTEPIGFSWSVIHAYVRLITNRRILSDPFTMKEAVAVVDESLAQPVAIVLNPGHHYWPAFRDVLLTSPVTGDTVNDAHIAALALEHDATICTADRDFDRFRGVRVINPLT